MAAAVDRAERDSRAAPAAAEGGAAAQKAAEQTAERAAAGLKGLKEERRALGNRVGELEETLGAERAQAERD
eukprot:gene41762-62856_t